MWNTGFFFLWLCFNCTTTTLCMSSVETNVSFAADKQKNTFLSSALQHQWLNVLMENNIAALPKILNGFGWNESVFFFNSFPWRIEWATTLFPSEDAIKHMTFQVHACAWWEKRYQVWISLNLCRFHRRTWGWGAGSQLQSHPESVCVCVCFHAHDGAPKVNALRIFEITLRSNDLHIYSPLPPRHSVFKRFYGNLEKLYI